MKLKPLLILLALALMLNVGIAWLLAATLNVLDGKRTGDGFRAEAHLSWEVSRLEAIGSMWVGSARASHSSPSVSDEELNYFGSTILRVEDAFCLTCVRKERG